MPAGSTSASGQIEYVVGVRTAADSGCAGAYIGVFVVSAHTADSEAYWVSDPDSGRCVDNLPPAVPSGFTLVDSVLTWDACPDEDFHHFSVYGSQSGGFGDMSSRPGNPIAPGIYFMSLQSGEFTASRKIVVLH